jgi:hypothetical protein
VPSSFEGGTLCATGKRVHTTIAAEEMTKAWATLVPPDSFEPSRHFYPRVLNAQVHPLVAYLMRLPIERIVSRYCHLNPGVDMQALEQCLRTNTKHFHWGGADLFYTVTDQGVRRMTVLETNSCPSGNKSMPILSEDQEQGGFRTLLEHCFMPLLKRRKAVHGGLAVIYDKNFMAASGYAAALADLAGENVFLAPLAEGQADPPARFEGGVLVVRDEEGEWHPIRAAMRYVTQTPWARIPVATKTVICNPVIACLAGGRNKLVASKAYEFLNASLGGSGLAVRTPETIRDVSHGEIPLWVQRFGGYAVVKVPYSNAGQGVFTITSPEELNRLMEMEFSYDRFIVQGLIGNSAWTSVKEGSRYYHVGTMPDRQNKIYVADLRVTVASGPDGFRPIAIYARRARAPLAENVEDAKDSWSMLGTNLSEKRADGGWNADTDRLLLMDRRDFNKLGLGPDDLLEAYIQSVLSVVAIDRMSTTLIGKAGGLKRRLFRSLNDDRRLLDEVMGPSAKADHQVKDSK